MVNLRLLKEKTQKLHPNDFLSVVSSYIQNQNMECPEDYGDFSFLIPTRKINIHDFGTGLLECSLWIRPVRLIGVSETRYCVYLSLWPLSGGTLTWYTKAPGMSEEEARTMYRTIHNHLKTCGWEWGVDESNVEEMDAFFLNNFGFSSNHG